MNYPITSALSMPVTREITDPFRSMFRSTPIVPSLVLDFINEVYSVGPAAAVINRDFDPEEKKTLEREDFDDLITFSRASPGWHYDATGLFIEAATDQARLDYDPVTRASRGLLIEEERTNLFNFSDDLSNSVWIKNYVTVDTSSEIAPDGSFMEQVTQGFNGIATLGRVINLVDTTNTYTITRVVKKGNFDWIRLQIGGGAGSGVAWFNLATGRVGTVNNSGSGTGVSASIEDLGNGRYRCGVTVTLTTTTASIPMYGAIGDGSNTRVDGGFFYTCDAQLEIGTSATTYIPTTDTAKTRSADIASVNTLTPWLDAAEGTLLVESNTESRGGISSGPTALADASNATGARVGFFINETDSDTWTGSVRDATGVEQAHFVGPVVVAGGVMKAAIAYKANNFAASFNGSAVQTDTSGTVPTVTRLRIGNFDAGAFNGHLRSILYCPRRLSDAELQMITQ